MLPRGPGASLKTSENIQGLMVHCSFRPQSKSLAGAYCHTKMIYYHRAELTRSALQLSWQARGEAAFITNST